MLQDIDDPWPKTATALHLGATAPDPLFPDRASSAYIRYSSAKSTQRERYITRP